MNELLKKLPLWGSGGLIKVCGMRDQENIRAASALDIDLMGFIFWDKSPREAPSRPPRGEEANFAFGSHVKKVGVFVDENLENIIARVNDYRLDFVQLHGKESAAYIDNLRKLTTAKIIKAISIREADDVKRWQEYEGHVDMLLFDTKCKCVGGSGEKFDWSVLDNYDGDIPFLLSGGIGPDDAGRVKAFRHPSCIGIDLNSMFEDAPGLKNIDNLRKFIKVIRNE